MNFTVKLPETRNRHRPQEAEQWKFRTFVHVTKRRWHRTGRTSLICPSCGTDFPVVQGVPVLIDDDSSVFRRADYAGAEVYKGDSYGTVSDEVSGPRRHYRRLIAGLESLSCDVATFEPKHAVQQMLEECPTGRVLVVGAGEADYDHPNVVYTDVAFGSRTICICDAHSLPFPDGYFHGAVAVAVLEHVADPYRCVEELHRVLDSTGLVYADTPFLQPVHMGAHDFTRFTYLGHRRLFRWFDHERSGCSRGPATSLAGILPHLLASASDAAWWRRIARLVGFFLAVPIRQLDRLVGRSQGAYDAAAAIYFFGRKRAAPYSDRQILAMYRGAQVG